MNKNELMDILKEKEKMNKTDEAFNEWYDQDESVSIYSCAKDSWRYACDYQRKETIGEVIPLIKDMHDKQVLSHCGFAYLSEEIIKKLMEDK